MYGADDLRSALHLPRSVNRIESTPVCHKMMYICSCILQWSQGCDVGIEESRFLEIIPESLIRVQTRSVAHLCLNLSSSMILLELFHRASKAAQK